MRFFTFLTLLIIVESVNSHSSNFYLHARRSTGIIKRQLLGGLVGGTFFFGYTLYSTVTSIYSPLSRPTSIITKCGRRTTWRTPWRQSITITITHSCRPSSSPESPSSPLSRFPSCNYSFVVRWAWRCSRRSFESPCPSHQRTRPSR